MLLLQARTLKVFTTLLVAVSRYFAALAPTLLLLYQLPFPTFRSMLKDVSLLELSCQVTRYAMGLGFFTTFTLDGAAGVLVVDGGGGGGGGQSPEQLELVSPCSQILLPQTGIIVTPSTVNCLPIQLDHSVSILPNLGVPTLK
mgnify:CR=1 FL=1